MGMKLCVHIGNEGSSSGSTAVEEMLCSVAEHSLPTSLIAKTIGVPDGTLVRYEFSNEHEAFDPNGIIKVKLTVRASDDLSALLSSELEAQVGDLILERLDGLVVTKLYEYIDRVGPSHPARLQFEVSDDLPRQVSSSDLAAHAGFRPGTVLGWQKGCNSWPW